MSRLRRRARGRNILGVVLIAVVFLALGAFALAAALLKAPPVDAETLCRTDQPLNAHTIILVDATDRLEPRHRRKLRAVAEQERARLAQYDRLTLLRLNPRKPEEPIVLFSKCLPKPPEDANPLFENPRLMRAQWDSAFESALDQALHNAQHGAGRTSPILASVRAAAADPDFGREIPHRRLVVVSDLLEYDRGGLSLYGQGVSYATWRAAPEHHAADLTHVDIRLAPFDRPDFTAQQSAAIAQFWTPYFEDADAGAVQVDPY